MCAHHKELVMAKQTVMYKKIGIDMQMYREKCIDRNRYFDEPSQ